MVGLKEHWSIAWSCGAAFGEAIDGRFGLRLTIRLEARQRDGLAIGAVETSISRKRRNLASSFSFWRERKPSSVAFPADKDSSLVKSMDLNC
jgi:hypothetical protein